MSWGWVMKQNWVSQIMRRLGSMEIIWSILRQFGTKTYLKSWYNSKNVVNIADFLFVQTVQIPPDWNVLILADQNVSILLAKNMYNENVKIFWHRKLCMKNCYSSKYFSILLIFLWWIFEPKMARCPQLTYYSNFIGEVIPSSTH